VLFFPRLRVSLKMRVPFSRGMNDARRQKVLKVMAVVLIAFGGSLLYFLFFNSGLIPRIKRVV